MYKVKANDAVSLSQIKAEHSTLFNDVSRRCEIKFECFFEGRDYQLGVRRAEISKTYPILISVFALKLPFIYRIRDGGGSTKGVLVSSAA